MKKLIVSTFTAAALAVPLGIGGAVLTAPATATNADAQSGIDHHFATCSVDVILRCASRIQGYVFLHGRKFGYTSKALPYLSNGADYKAYDYLRERLDSGELHPRVRTLWQEGFDNIFPDGVRPPEPPPLTEEELQERIDRLTFQNSPGQTTVEQITNFNNRCEEQGGVPTQRFQFGQLDLGANQCRIEAEVPNDDPNAAPVTISETAEFRLNPAVLSPSDPIGRLLADMGDHLPGPLFQVNELEPFAPVTNPNPFTDTDTDEADVIAMHRERIIELQDEVILHDEAIASMLEVQNGNSTSIRENTASVAALNTRMNTFADDIRKNTAGIALAYAFPSSGLNYNESFRLSGGAGYFRDDAAVAFGFTGRLSQHVTASGGVGLGDGVSGGRVEIGYGW